MSLLRKALSRRQTLIALAAAAFPNAALASQDDPAQWVLPLIPVPGLERVVFPSRAAGRDVSFYALHPQGPQLEQGRRYPVLIWLHGTGGAQRSPGPLAQMFSEAMASGALPPVHVVFPNGLTSSLWCDSSDGAAPIETIVIKEILPLIDARYQIAPGRDNRMIEGFSMGGFGAARLAFRYPELFGAVSMLGAGPLQATLSSDTATPRNRVLADRIIATVFGGDQDRFRAESPRGIVAANAARLSKGLAIQMAIGAKDFTLPANRNFSASLTEHAIPHRFFVAPGVDHNAIALIRAKGWAFHREALRAAAPT